MTFYLFTHESLIITYEKGLPDIDHSATCSHGNKTAQYPVYLLVFFFYIFKRQHDYPNAHHSEDVLLSIIHYVALDHTHLKLYYLNI